jgi:vitamin B12 transporter
MTLTNASWAQWTRSIRASLLTSLLWPTLGLAQRGAHRVLCVTDAATSAPLVGATVRVRTGPALLLSDGCLRIDAGRDTLLVARMGYQSQRQVATEGIDTLWVALTALATPYRLSTARVTATMTSAGASVGQVAASLQVDDARERGAATTTGLLGLLPYTQLRSARGETALSLRGARREQVVITLDGLPLNDPATGVADISDLPLAALGSATVVPGADPINVGSGATGGVLALTTSPQQLVAARMGAFGERQVEGAWTAASATTRWHGAASWRTTTNDFVFLNDAGAVPVREQRVNNDTQRATLTVGLVAPRTQWSLLTSVGEQGMVGPANVRSNDEDRARTERLVLRGQQQLGATQLTAGVRGFVLAYRDPTRPALDTRARAWAADVDWRGQIAGGSWRVGVGADGLRGSNAVSQQRSRAFMAYGVERPWWSNPHRSRGEWNLALRGDMIERAGVQPTATLGARYVAYTSQGRVEAPARTTVVALVGRAAQAMRVPTLYDLYFSSPQRLIVRALDPERVVLDANLGVTGTVVRGAWRANGELLGAVRTTRNAIVWFPGNFGWSPANVGRESLRGVEARLAIERKQFLWSAWSTYYDTRLLTNGLEIPTPYVPRLAAGAQGAITMRQLRISGNLRYQGARPFTAGPRNPFFELPSVWLADLAASRTVTVGRTVLLLTAALDNVTNAQWQSVRGFPMPGRTWSTGITIRPTVP